MTENNNLLRGIKILVVVILLCIISYTDLIFADFKLSMPLDCQYGKDCFIQNYVDMSSDDNYKDYKCSNLSYNTHKGTDFRLIDYVAMENGYNVLAAADGTVKGVRDNQDNFVFLNEGKEALDNKECGNGILIDHEDGYSTQYCHLQKGSLQVKENQKVKTGDILGKVGMSGETQFPHVHISVKKDNKTLDPFTGKEPSENYNCSDTENIKSLWNDSISAKLKYIDTAILNFYITDKQPNGKNDKFKARKGDFREDALNTSSKKIILWADVMGIKKTDKLVFELQDTKTNKNIINTTKRPDSKYVLYFVYIGKKLSKDTLAKGSYKAKVSLYRNQQLIDSKEKEIIVN